MTAARASMLLREVRGALRNANFGGAADRLPPWAPDMAEALQLIRGINPAIYKRLPAAIREHVDKLRSVAFAAGVAAVADPAAIDEPVATTLAEEER